MSNSIDLTDMMDLIDLTDVRLSRYLHLAYF